MGRTSVTVAPRDTNKARNEARSHARLKTCSACHAPFYAGDVRQRLCQICRARGYRFVAIDGEGIPVECRQCDCRLFRPSAIPDECVCGHPQKSLTGDLTSGHQNQYVLLGIGDYQVSSVVGLQWHECLTAMYSQYDPKAIYVGFFLSYDFNMITRTMPWNKAVQLWTKHGINKRRRKNKADVAYSDTVKVDSGIRAGDVSLPVVQKRIEDGIISADQSLVWELHLHADRRLHIRPFVCGCPGDHHRKYVDRASEPHPVADFMYINDVGGFFQSAFLSVIDPSDWSEPIVTDEEFALLEKGKKSRDHAMLGPEMARYNRLENEILARIMTKYAEGLSAEGINLSKRNWYGPGQAAQAWLNKEGAPLRKVLEKVVPSEFFNMARESYMGAWFELMIHGPIPGLTPEYDINSAYPYIISKLPCLEHGKYSRKIKPKVPRQGLPKLPKGAIRLVRCAVWGSDPYIGAMLFRDMDHSILRPSALRGTFWQHELEAAMRAGLIDRIECYEWMTYEPCDCFPPMRRVANLYEKRLAVGKNTPLGKALKLIYNSKYGKFAQSIGDPPYANPIYASLITAGCRSMILDAIATHPDKSKAVAMVATDGIYFLSPHPGIEAEIERFIAANPGKKKDDRLGMWERSDKMNLTLFKPGVYWDDKAREAIAAGDKPTFKARGVRAADFAPIIKEIDQEFASWDGTLPVSKEQWPARTFRLGFSMISAKQALARGSADEDSPENRAQIARERWKLCGLVSEVTMTHSSWPGSKRVTAEYNGHSFPACSMRELGEYDGRIYRSKPHSLKPSRDGKPAWSLPYDKAFGATAMYENGKLDQEEYGLTPDGLVRDLWYEAMQIRG